MRALVAGLSVAGLVAIVALLTGTWDDTDWRVVGTSLGFSVFSATAAAGEAVRRRLVAIGGAAVASSATAFVLLVVAIWDDDLDDVWRAFGVAGLVALWASHASLMLGPLRDGDSVGVRRLTWVSVVSLGIDAAAGSLACVGLLDDLEFDLGARLLAMLVVVAVLSSVLVPLLRRLQASAPAATVAAPPSAAEEIAAIAARLAAADLPPAAAADVRRLESLARSLRR